MSSIKSFLTQNCPPKPSYKVDDVPDLSGKIVIVTGGNTGVGKETAKALLVHNAKVYIGARNQAKAEAAIKDLKESTGKGALFLKLDLADLKKVKAAAEEFLSKESELHVLFNNGGVMGPPIEMLTSDGYDLQFGTNVLGHFYFTKLLLPLLISTAKASPGGKTRVVNTASVGHMFMCKLDFETFKDGPKRKKMATESLYFQSKFANIVYATELARRYGDEGIVSTSLHPGNLRSDLQRHTSGITLKITDLMLSDVALGALTQLYAGTSLEGKDFNGKYLIPWARLGTALAETQDPQTGKELWEWLEDQVKDV